MTDLKGSTKLLGFFRKLNKRVIRPRYSALMRTGRVSARDPNLQQLPRGPEFRSLIVAPEGKLIHTCDYSFIELVTLAHIQEQRYGKSTLADVIRDGLDPHAYTASMLRDESYDEFIELKDSDPKTFKLWRAYAKPANFGLPTGMSADTLQRYAASSYGVTLTTDQAVHFREAYRRAFPEIEQYWAEDSCQILADNLHTDTEAVREYFAEDWQLGTLQRICRGCEEYSDGREYPEDMVDEYIEALADLNHNPRWDTPIADRDFDKLPKLGWSPVATLSGRIRGRVNYTTYRNTPFQGSAADGAKTAMWRLYREGFECIGFIHDEFLTLVDEGNNEHQVQRIEQILIESMKPFVGTVPVKVGSTVARQWEKP